LQKQLWQCRAQNIVWRNRMVGRRQLYVVANLLCGSRW
jgi:hypothetical protein